MFLRPSSANAHDLANMFKKVDCVLFRVPDLEKALAFYRDNLHHKLAWRRGDSSAGLRMDQSDTEIVLMAETGMRMEIDLLVDSVDQAPRIREGRRKNSSRPL